MPRRPPPITPPDLPISSLGVLFATAHALEARSAESYARLAARAAPEGVAGLAPLFTRLSEIERLHVARIDAWARRDQADPGDATAASGGFPDAFEEETGTDVAGSGLGTAYRVLTLAVRNEERAFQFWSHVAAAAPNAEIRAVAESLAREELEHVALLRRERRRAFHAERRQHPAPPIRVEDRLARAARLELTLAVALDGLAARAPEQAATAARWAERARAHAGLITAGWATLPAAEEKADDDAARAPAAAAEALVEDYLELGEQARDEDLVALMQQLGEQAILRLAWLRRAEKPAA